LSRIAFAPAAPVATRRARYVCLEPADRQQTAARARQRLGGQRPSWSYRSMKKPTRLKKLVLTTTTVRALDAAPLASVAGARKVTLISLMPTGPLC
jgi:hypothetical protein